MASNFKTVHFANEITHLKTEPILLKELLHSFGYPCCSNFTRQILSWSKPHPQPSCSQTLVTSVLPEEHKET